MTARYSDTTYQRWEPFMSGVSLKAPMVIDVECDLREEV